MPDTWIERIFQVMAGKYGARLSDAWHGVPPEIVKKEWSRSLGLLTPGQIVRGIELLDECKFPPTLPEFVSLCKRATPQSHMMKLKAPPLTEEDKAKGREILAKMKLMTKSKTVAEQHV